jgi:hypothetical protein
MATKIEYKIKKILEKNNNTIVIVDFNEVTPAPFTGVDGEKFMSYSRKQIGQYEFSVRIPKGENKEVMIRKFLNKKLSEMPNKKKLKLMDDQKDSKRASVVSELKSKDLKKPKTKDAKLSR